MKRSLIIGAAVLLLGIQVETANAELVEMWRATGFDLPESVSFDEGTNAYYVSNLGKDPTSKDGDGFISKLNADGSVADLKWATGLNAPKGTEVVGDRLFVADIDELVELDLATGDIVARYPVEAAQFLNDLAVAVDGRIFLSDTLANAIYLFENGRVSTWLKDPALDSPNGLTIDRTDLIVATTGGLGPDSPGGTIKTVDLLSKEIGDFGSSETIGGLDGIEPTDDGSMIVTDNPGGRILEVARGEPPNEIGDVEPGAADLELRPDHSLLILPQMQDNIVVAYHME